MHEPFYAAKGFGVRKVGEPGTTDPDTVFQIASLSKSLSGSVVAAEVGNGTLAWDTRRSSPICMVRAEGPVGDRRMLTLDITPSHRIGPARPLPGDNLEDLGFDRREVLERLRLLPLDSFRDSHAYTNFGLDGGSDSRHRSRNAMEDLAASVLYQRLG